MVSAVLRGRHLSGAHLNLLEQLSHPHLLPMIRNHYDDSSSLFLHYQLLTPHRTTLLDYVLTQPKVSYSVQIKAFENALSP